MVLNSLKKYQTNMCFGSPVTSLLNGKVVYESFKYRSYEQCITEATNFGHGLTHLELCPSVSEFRDYTCRFVSVYAPNIY
jgi:hypothetical protein